MTRFFQWTAGILFAGAILAGCGGAEGGPVDNGNGENNNLREHEVEVAPVERRDFERTFRGTGSLIPKEEASVRALAGGTLDVVNVDIGDTVSEGDVLFRTRQVDAENSVRQAEAGLKSAEARLAQLRAWSRDEEIDSARARVRQARTRHQRASDERERMRVLFERGSVSPSEWEEAQAAADAAESELEAVQAQLNIAERGPTAEEIAVAETEVERAEAGLAQARQALEDTEVRAPYDGVITGRYAKAGDFVNRGQDVVRISALEVLEAEMHIPERFAGIMETGLAVNVRLDTHDLTREGTVVAVNQAIDRQTRTFEIKVHVPNEDLSIKAGAFGVGEFVLPAQRDVLGVPHEAVIEREGEHYVWVADNGEARRVYVRLGERAEDFVHIREGLEEGQQVVVRGFGALAEGDDLVIAARD